MDASYRGAVKWFDENKRYGFIECPDLGADVFVHLSTVRASGYDLLREGDYVEVVLQPSSRPNTTNLKAKKVTLIPVEKRERPDTKRLSNVPGAQIWRDQNIYDRPDTECRQKLSSTVLNISEVKADDAQINLGRRAGLGRKRSVDRFSHAAQVYLIEAYDDGRKYHGELKLSETKLQFTGSYWGSTKTIARQVRFISAVEKQFGGPYVIRGGGKGLYIESANTFFTGEDLKSLIAALQAYMRGASF